MPFRAPSAFFASSSKHMIRAAAIRALYRLARESDFLLLCQASQRAIGPQPVPLFQAAAHAASRVLNVASREVAAGGLAACAGVCEAACQPLTSPVIWLRRSFRSAMAL